MNAVIITCRRAVPGSLAAPPHVASVVGTAASLLPAHPHPHSATAADDVATAIARGYNRSKQAGTARPGNGKTVTREGALKIQ